MKLTQEQIAEVQNVYKAYWDSLLKVNLIAFNSFLDDKSILVSKESDKHAGWGHSLAYSLEIKGSGGKLLLSFEVRTGSTFISKLPNQTTLCE